MKDVLTDGLAQHIGGWIGRDLDACLENGLLAADWQRYAQAWQQKLDSDGAFHGEFWGKWFTGAVQGVRYRDTPENRALLQNAVDALLAAQQPDGRLSASAQDFTVWDLWGRKYALLGLAAWYAFSGDETARQAACRALDDIIAHTAGAGVRVCDTGLRALRGLSSCSILQPVVQLYLLTKNEAYLAFAKKLVAEWSEPAADGSRGLCLLEDALAGMPPVNIASPKGYEVMSCWEGICELYRATGDETLLRAVVAYTEAVMEREVMITGSSSSAELWCEGRFRQTQLLEAPMETCVTATHMKLCHQLLRLTGEVRRADALEISLFNALSGAMRADGGWWAYFSPLLGQRVPSQVQLPFVGSSCCVVNGPRALTEVPLWALMHRADGCALNLYQPGIYRCGADEEAWQLRQRTEYPAQGSIHITVEAAPAQERVLALRIPAWSKTARVWVNGSEQPAAPGWCELRRRWHTGDEVRLELDMAVRTVSAPGNPVYKALMTGPVVLALDERYCNAPAGTSLWLMNDAQHTAADAQLNTVYYPVQSLPQENDIPLAKARSLPGTHLAFDVQFLERRIHFWDHTPMALTFCDYASAGSDLAACLRVWFPCPLYTDGLFLGGTKRVVNPFAAEEPQDTLSGSTL